MSKIELMSPAGSFECMMAAIQGGCDSVYFGVEQLNMRARATMNFVVDDLPEIAKLCKEHNVRSYLTLNTIVYDHEEILIDNVKLVKMMCGDNSDNIAGIKGMGVKRFLYKSLLFLTLILLSFRIFLINE